MWINGTTTTGNLVLGNFIGTNLNGTKAVPNGDDGVFIQDAPNNTVGGSTTDGWNLISGNDFNGVELSGSGATGNLVQNDIIGLDETWAKSLPNGSDGIDIVSGAGNNTVGGTTSTQANLISGNAFAGVYLNGGGTAGNTVLGNLIGLDYTGRRPSRTRPTASSDGGCPRQHRRRHGSGGPATSSPATSSRACDHRRGHHRQRRRRATTSAPTGPGPGAGNEDQGFTSRAGPTTTPSAARRRGPATSSPATPTRA